MMTTMAATFGGLPLAIGMGVGSELRRPLGITIVGGLLVSQALTLFTTPVVYLFFDKLQWKVMKLHKVGVGAGRGDRGLRSCFAAFASGPTAARFLGSIRSSRRIDDIFETIPHRKERDFPLTQTACNQQFHVSAF